MQESDENERQEYLDLLMEIEEKKYTHKTKRRPLIWYRNIVIVFLILLLGAIGVVGIFSANSYIGGWSIFGIFVFGILFLVLLVYFFLDSVEGGEEQGFKGLSRIHDLVELKEEIEWLEIQAEMLKSHQTHLLSVQSNINSIPMNYRTPFGTINVRQIGIAGRILFYR
jgi:hypothetical protein